MRSSVDQLAGTPALGRGSGVHAGWCSGIVFFFFLDVYILLLQEYMILMLILEKP